MEKICLGKSVKLHGYLGGMKINTKFDDDFDILQIKRLFDENDNEFEVQRIFKVKDGVVVILKDVDLELAKKMINKNFFMDRELVKDKILIEDLKGSDVYIDGEKVGTIFDVQDFGTAEVFYMEKVDTKEVLFPNVNGIIESFDYHEKKLVLNKSKFLEVTDEDWCFNIVSK